MDFSFIVPLLALLTLLGVCGMALFGKKKIEDRRHDPNAPVSTLAKDGPQGGVDLISDGQDASQMDPPDVDPPRADPPRKDQTDPPRADPPNADLPDPDPAPRPGDISTGPDSTQPGSNRTAH